jgi:hypothetical protein
MDESTQQREVRDRVLAQYLSAWCTARSRPAPLNPSAFIAPDWSFLTPGLARWFLAAIDEGVVNVTSDADFEVGGSYCEGIVEHGRTNVVPRPSKLRRESFVEIAAAGMLGLRYAWPSQRLRFQSPRLAFDLLAYADHSWTEVDIAAEAKRLQSDALALSASLKICGGLGMHSLDACTQPANHHRKYVELLELRPRILWIVGPDTFSEGPDLVFRVELGRRGIVHLRPTKAIQLTAPSI